MSIINVTKTTDPNSGIVISRSDTTVDPSAHIVCAADPALGVAVGATWDRESCSFIGASMTLVAPDGSHEQVALPLAPLADLSLSEGIDALHDACVLAPLVILAGMLGDLDGQ